MPWPLFIQSPILRALPPQEQKARQLETITGGQSSHLSDLALPVPPFQAFFLPPLRLSSLSTAPPEHHGWHPLPVLLEGLLQELPPLLSKVTLISCQSYLLHSHGVNLYLFVSAAIASVQASRIPCLDHCKCFGVNLPGLVLALFQLTFHSTKPKSFIKDNAIISLTYSSDPISIANSPLLFSEDKKKSSAWSWKPRIYSNHMSRLLYCRTPKLVHNRHTGFCLLC